MPPELIALVGVVCTMSGAIIGVLGFRRISQKDISDRGKSDGILLTEIGYIKAGIDDLKRKDDRRDEQHVETAKQLAAIGESAKQAHKRIDFLEKKGV